MSLRQRAVSAILRLPHVGAKDLWRAARWYVTGVTALQAAAVATVLTVDQVRKLREPPTGEFPRTEPKSVPVADSLVTTFTYGADLYEDMLARIDDAEHTIFFETFIWKSDETGQRFKDALLAAARRGVEVFIVFDSWGNTVVSPRFKQFPDLPNLHVLKFPFFRPGLLTFNLRKTGRDHRKLLVVDGVSGYVGGYNIGDLYATSWRDTHLRVDGPSAWELENAFVDFWNDHRRKKSNPRSRTAVPARGTRASVPPRTPRRA